MFVMSFCRSTQVLVCLLLVIHRSHVQVQSLWLGPSGYSTTQSLTIKDVDLYQSITSLQAQSEQFQQQITQAIQTQQQQFQTQISQINETFQQQFQNQTQQFQTQSQQIQRQNSQFQQDITQTTQTRQQQFNTQITSLNQTFQQPLQTQTQQFQTQAQEIQSQNTQFQQNITQTTQTQQQQMQTQLSQINQTVQQQLQTQITQMQTQITQINQTLQNQVQTQIQQLNGAINQLNITMQQLQAQGSIPSNDSIMMSATFFRLPINYPDNMPYFPSAAPFPVSWSRSGHLISIVGTVTMTNFFCVYAYNNQRSLANVQLNFPTISTSIPPPLWLMQAPQSPYIFSLSLNFQTPTASPYLYFRPIESAAYLTIDIGCQNPGGNVVTTGFLTFNLMYEAAN